MTTNRNKDKPRELQTCDNCGTDWIGAFKACPNCGLEKRWPSLWYLIPMVPIVLGFWGFAIWGVYRLFWG